LRCTSGRVVDGRHRAVERLFHNGVNVSNNGTGNTVGGVHIQTRIARRVIDKPRFEQGMHGGSLSYL
jgi:hypothetical protein